MHQNAFDGRDSPVDYLQTLVQYSTGRGLF